MQIKKPINDFNFNSLNDFYIEKGSSAKLGSGSFANVILGRSIKTNIQYAIKSVF